MHEQEVNVYIENIKKTFGTFNHAPLKSVIDPTLLAEYKMQMIPGTGILHKIDTNATYNNDEGAEVSSSSNITTGSGTGTGTGTGSTNSSIATTMDESRSSDPNDIEEQPSKKARLSTAPDDAECIPMDQTNDDGQSVGNPLEAAATGMNESATISLELFEQLRKANVCFEQQLNEKAFAVERLKHEKQALVDENEHLKKCLEEKTNQINKAEAAQQKTSQQIDRAALIELVKTTKICVGCNRERPADTLHFCDIGCQKLYLLVITKARCHLQNIKIK